MTIKIKELEEFKDEIRSCLISAPQGVPLHSLNNDYYGILGKNIPYRELGFPTLLCLLSCIPDTVRLVGHRNDLIAVGVSNEKVAHVADLVKRQRKPSSGYHKYKSRANQVTQRPLRCVIQSPSPFPPKVLMPPDARQQLNNLNVHMPRYVSTEKLRQQVQMLLIEYPSGLQEENLKLAFRQRYGKELRHQDYNFVRFKDFVRSLEKEGVLRIQENTNLLLHPSHNQQLVDNSKELSTHIRNLNSPQMDKLTKNVFDIIQSSNISLRSAVYDNLLKVMDNSPEGFTLSELSQHYYNVTGASLNFGDLGYSCLRELISDLDDIFCVQSLSNGELLLTDARVSEKLKDRVKEPLVENEKPIKVPDEVQQNIYNLLFNISEGISLSKFEHVYEINFREPIQWKDLNYSSLHSMLMALDFYNLICITQSGPSDMKVNLMSQKSTENQSFLHALPKARQSVPEDALVLNEGYNPPSIPSAGDYYFHVFISSVDSPGKIWIQVLSKDEDRNVELDQLMVDVEKFYKSSEADRYKMPDEFLNVNMDCAVRCPKNQTWHRGCIIGKPDPHNYDVFCYDYGTVCQVDKSLLWFLKKSFAVLPAQAFSARLANIQPLLKNFSIEASQRLSELACPRKRLKAQITSEKFMNTTSVILLDTIAKKVITLNSLLVLEGLVRANLDPVGTQSNNSECVYKDINCHQISVGTEMLGLPVFQPLDSTFITPLDFGKCQIDLTRNSGPEIIQKLFLKSESQPFPCPDTSETWSITNSQERTHGDFLPDPAILKRLKSSNLTKRISKLSLSENLSISQAAIEPIQVKGIKNTNSENLPLLSLNQFQIILNHEIPNEYNKKPKQSQGGLHKSSREDTRQQEHLITDSLLPNSQVRFCKRVDFREPAYTAHLINYNGKPCFTSSDVSSFVFGIDIVKKILHIQRYPVCHILVLRKDKPSLFADLEYHRVSGFTTEDIHMEKVVLYVLSDVVNILQFLGYDKQTVIEDIEEMHNNFDSRDAFWMSRPESEDSTSLSSHRQVVEFKLQIARKDRKSLLCSMMDKDASTKEDLEQLLLLDKEISKMKISLTKLKEPSTPSAAEQVQKFLERMKLGQG